MLCHRWLSSASVAAGFSHLDLANMEAIPLLEPIVATLLEMGKSSVFSFGSPKCLNFQCLFKKAIDNSLRLERKLPRAVTKNWRCCSERYPRMTCSHPDFSLRACPFPRGHGRDCRGVCLSLCEGVLFSTRMSPIVHITIFYSSLEIPWCKWDFIAST